MRISPSIFVSVFCLFVLAGSLTAQETPGAASTGCPVVRFAIIGDRAGDHQPGIYEEIVAEVERLKPDFVITVGDEIEGYTEDTVTLNQEWDEYYSIVKPLTMPLHILASNHNITTDGMLPVFEKRVGKPYRSFNVGTLHFILMDNSRWDSSDKIPKEQLDWLTSDLAAYPNASKTFVFMHKPLWYNTLAVGKPDTLHTLFVKYGVDAVFAGHFHQYFSATFDSILYTCIGSSGGAMDSDPTGMGYQFAWVTVDKNDIFVAPIKINSVLPWDVVTVADMQLIDRMNQLAVSIENAVSVEADLTVPASTVTVSIHNFAKETPVNDTIRWEIPKGWSVEPGMLPVAVAPGGAQKFNFQVKGAGELYPVPSFAVKLPFKAGRDITVRKEMRVAREAACPFVSKGPTIDGKLDEAIWKEPVTHLFNPDGGPIAIESTYFYFAYDRANLYLAAQCKESSLDSLVAKSTARDGAIFGEDCVGYFLQPDLSKDTSFQVYFSALGTVFDQKISMGTEGYYGGDKGWNGNYTVKTSKGGGYWSVEARVPLAQFGIRPAKGMKMGINFLRKQQHRKGAADWQAPIDYNPRSYGVLVLQ